MKSKIMPWLGMLISIAFILLLAFIIDPQEVIDTLLSADYWWLIPAVLVSLTSFIFRGFRFKVILGPLRKISLRRSYQYIAINYMANNVLPARAGEVMLSYVVRQHEQIPLSSSLSVTVLGRILDGLLLLGVLALSLKSISAPSWTNTVLLLGMIAFGGAMVFMLWLIFGKADHWSAMRQWTYGLVPGWLEKLFHIGANQLKQFRNGVLPLRNFQIFGWVVVASVLNWICEGTVYFLVGQAFNFDLPLMNWLFVIALTNLATAIPSAPAGFGTFHGAAIGSLLALGAGVSPDAAAAYALVLHATQVIPVTTVGAISYFRLSLHGAKSDISMAKS